MPHVAILLSALLAGRTAASQRKTLQIDTERVLTEISERFMSFAMGAQSMTHPNGLEKDIKMTWHSSVAQTYAKALAPAYLRFGGTRNDFAVYDFGGNTYDIIKTDPVETEVLFNSTFINALFDFTEAAGWELIFGANAATARKTDGSWDSRGLKALLKDVEPKKFAGVELGNEPDLFNKHHKSDWLTVESRLEDFEKFRQVLNEGGQADALAIGPDVTRSNVTYMKIWADGVGSNADVATWHFYYGPGSSSSVPSLTPEDFCDPETMDLFLTKSQQMEEATASWRGAQGKRELWVGETSSTYGGGSKNTSSSFLAGFLWLDKLGVAAYTGVKVVLRQTFSGAEYSVIGRDNLPNPDYFSSLLWRRLVGDKVLPVTDVLSTGRTFRAYAFCSRQRTGGVTVVWLNAQDQEVYVAHGLKGRQELYTLTSYPGVLTSRDLFLNGDLLRVDASGKLVGDLTPEPMPSGQVLILPSFSYGFLELPDAGASACSAAESLV